MIHEIALIPKCGLPSKAHDLIQKFKIFVLFKMIKSKNILLISINL